MLSKQLQEQIEQESNDRAEGWQDKMKSQIAKTEYELGAEKYAALYETAVARAERAEKALQQIQKWELPNTGKFWDKEMTQPMSYEACYGSNGARDYFRNLANHVLNGTTETITPKTGEDE